MDPLLHKILLFLQGLNIGIETTTINENTFLPGIAIIDGKIYIDLKSIENIGDILHEAGHIAISDPAIRHELCESMICNSGMREAEEMMAIAWSYAACVHLKIDPNIVFHENGYKGGGGYIVENFSQGNYFGVPMLAYYGMTIEPKPKEKISDFHFPKMIRWLR